MKGGPGGELEAPGQLELQSHDAIAPARPPAPGRNDHRHTGSDPHAPSLCPQSLDPIVEEQIAQSRRTAGTQDRNPVGELLLLIAQGPLLSEGVAPVPALRLPAEKADVLNDNPILVVRLLDQEAVVGDRRRFLCDQRSGKQRRERQTQQPVRGRAHASQVRNTPKSSQALRPMMATATVQANAASHLPLTNWPILAR